MTAGPPGARLADRVASLSAKQRALLARRLGLADGASHSAKALVAYVERADDQVTEDALHEFLASRLPHVMVPSAIILLEAFPHLPSGKVDRTALPDPDLSRPDPVSDVVAPRNDVERKLAQIWADVLGVADVGVHDNFFELGGDSILSIRIIARANEAGMTITPRDFFASPTVAELAAGASGPKPPSVSTPATGLVPITPIQSWFFEHISPAAQHWNQSVMLECETVVDAPALERALTDVVEHHDVLRMRFERGPDRNWHGHVPPAGDSPMLVVADLSATPESEIAATIQSVATREHENFDLGRGPLIRAVLFRLGAGRADRVLVIAHHLVVDAYSWGILTEDLERAYTQTRSGEPVVLPDKTTSFKAWAERLQASSRDQAVQRSHAFWADQESPDPGLPLDHPDGIDHNTVASAEVIGMVLDEDDTRALLRDAQQAYKTRVDEFLLAALYLAITGWTGHSAVVVDVEAHGRDPIFDDVDVSRTVGWFTTVFPVRLVPDSADPGVCIRWIKEHLRQIPRQGAEHGLLRYARESDQDAARFRLHRTPQINFNYLGEHMRSGSTSRVWREISGRFGEHRNLKGLRPYLIEINAAVQGGVLRAEWTFSTAVHHRRTIETLIQQFRQSLDVLTEHCLSESAGGATPSDFPLANLDQAALDHLGRLLEQRDQQE